MKANRVLFRIWWGVLFVTFPVMFWATIEAQTLLLIPVWTFAMGYSFFTLMRRAEYLQRLAVNAAVHEEHAQEEARRDLMAAAAAPSMELRKEEARRIALQRVMNQRVMESDPDYQLAQRIKKKLTAQK